MATIPGLGAYPAYGLNQASIQDTFHFNTNQFLVPVEGECSPLDYEDLFSMLNQPGTGSGGSSGGVVPRQSTDSDGWAASPAPVTVATSAPGRQPSQKQQHHPEPKQPKASRDVAPKRVRDAGNTSSKSKQHQVKELEALAAKKAEDLERLLQENNELKFRSRVLEKVIQIRDHQLKVMRGLPEDLPQYWGCRTQQDADAAATMATTAVTAASTTSTTGFACDGPGRSSTAVAAAAAGGGGGGVSVAAVIRTASCGCLLGALRPSLTAADRERFRSLGRSQLMDGWKHFLSEVAVPLLELESSPDDEAAAGRVRQLATEATHLFKHASLLAPDTVMVVSQTHLETEALTPAEPAHWRSVVRTLELTSEQVRELSAVFRLYGGIMRGVLEERRAINARLAKSAHGHYGGSPAELAAAMEQLTVSPECEVLQALQRSMRREKAAHLLLRAFLMGHTLSVLQFVKAAVYSYPWMPDATALVATVVEEAAAAGARGEDAPAGV